MIEIRMMIEMTAKTEAIAREKSLNASLKTLYPRYTPTTAENDAPKACISTITAVSPSNPNQIL